MSPIFGAVTGSNGLLLGYATVAVAGLVFLIVRLKVSAFIALTIASIFLGLVSGLSPAVTLKAFQDGMGAVLGSIAMVIALGTVLGKVLGETRAAESIALWLLKSFGSKRLLPAFFFIGLVVGLPVFFAVGLVLVAPVLYATCKREGLPLLYLGLPMVAGLSAAHGLVPPHPGPLAAIGLLQANIGKTILYSLPVALVAGFVAGTLCRRLYRLSAEHTDVAVKTESSPTHSPGYLVVLGVILLPIALMASASVAEVVLEIGSPLRRTFSLLGHPITALLVGVLLSIVVLARPAGFSREQVLKISEASLAPVALILLVVGAGAAFSRVLIESGVGKAVAEVATHWNLPAVPMGFALAALVRVATGSATVAITTAAGLVKPIADSQPGTNLELLVIAMGAGSLILSHVNDGGFWLVKEYLNISVPEALRSWTVLETILALVAFLCVLLMDQLL